MKLISIFQFWLKSKQNVIIEYKLSELGIHKKYSLCMEIVVVAEEVPEEAVFDGDLIRVIDSKPINVGSEQLDGGHCHGQILTTRILGPGVVRRCNWDRCNEAVDQSPTVV